MGRLASAIAVVGAVVLALCTHPGSAAAQVFRPRGKTVSVKPNTTKAAPVATTGVSLATTTVAQQEAAAKGVTAGDATSPARPTKKASRRVADAAPGKAKPRARAKDRSKAKAPVAKTRKHSSDDVQITDDDDDDDVKVDDE